MGGWARLSREQQARENAICKTVVGLGQAMGGEISYAPGLQTPSDHVVITLGIGDSRVRVILGDQYAQQLAQSYYDLARDYTIPGELVGAAFETAAGSLVSQLEGAFGTTFTVEGIANGGSGGELLALPFQGRGGALDGLTFFIAPDETAPPLQTPLVPNVAKDRWVMAYPVRLAPLGLGVDAFRGLVPMDILMPPGMAADDGRMAAALWINNYTMISGVVEEKEFIIDVISKGQAMADDEEELEDVEDEDSGDDDAEEAAESDDEDADDDHEMEAAGNDAGDGDEPADDDGGAAAEALLTGAGIDTLPVRIDFEIGRLELSFAELSALTPGQSFDLGSPPGDAVTLRVSGRKVGSGELVEIDGRVGVRIKSLIK